MEHKELQDLKKGFTKGPGSPPGNKITFFDKILKKKKSLYLGFRDSLPDSREPLN